MKMILLASLLLLVILDNASDIWSVSDPLDSQGTTRPEITHQEKAKYTQAALDNGIHGFVMLSIVFQSDGKIGKIEPVMELPDGLTEMAIEAAKKIRFKPAKKNGEPVSVKIIVEFTFALEYRDKRHLKQVIASVFPLLNQENLDRFTQAFDKQKTGTGTTDLWLIACEKKGAKLLSKIEQDEMKKIQIQALQLLPQPKQKIVEWIMKEWDADKLEDYNLVKLNILIFEGVALAPLDTQKRFIEIHNQAMTLGLAQFTAK